MDHRFRIALRQEFIPYISNFSGEMADEFQGFSSLPVDLSSLQQYTISVWRDVPSSLMKWIVAFVFPSFLSCLGRCLALSSVLRHDEALVVPLIGLVTSAIFPCRNSFTDLRNSISFCRAVCLSEEYGLLISNTLARHLLAATSRNLL